MALQICPVCKEKDFTWYMQGSEPDEPETGWYCGNCDFVAYEDERYNSDGTYRFESVSRCCTGCGSIYGIKLQKQGQQWLWCHHCHLLTQQHTPTASR